MECICGHKCDWNIDKNDYDGEEFINTDMYIYYNNNYDAFKETVYICPKCGTLKIDI